MSYTDRLKSFREELTRRNLDGFVVPLTDEHMSEYVGAYARRLAWLTGFQGSAGTAVVLQDRAAIFVDGRYTLQVRQQVDERHWTYESVPQSSTARWLELHTPPCARIGYDPWLHTKGWVAAARAALVKRKAELIGVETNPVDTVWPDQPAPSSAQISVYPEGLAGKSSAAKRRDLSEWLAAQAADAVVLSPLDTIAWTFNIRGSDIDHTPVALAYALVNRDATAELFVSPEKLTAEVLNHLGPAVRVRPPAAFTPYLRTLKNRTVAVDPDRVVEAIFEQLDRVGAKVIECRDPTVLPRALKNSTEIAGHKAAQVRDGAALTRFLHWLSVEAPKGAIDELSAASRLHKFREATGVLRDLSFDTISGFGSNAAVIHYCATPETNRILTAGSLYLVDSGAQYLDGTTDVTRTVAIEAPTPEMRDRFTRVLKGHIALATAAFPEGTCGVQLDVLARQYLWAVGLDYAHGTGHGVGAYLGVHEGPQRIITPVAAVGGGDEPLLPGMIISNEPVTTNRRSMAFASRIWCWSSSVRFRVRVAGCWASRP